MKVLITGVTGFLGSHLSTVLSKQMEIIGVTGSTSKATTDTDIKMVAGNQLETINGPVDVVVLCHAAVSSGSIKVSNRELFNANVFFTEQIKASFPNAYHLYVSSVSVYGSAPQTIKELTLLDPLSEYAVSKLWGETVLNSMDNFGILRLSSLYGIGMKDNTIIPRYVHQALANGNIEVWGNGQRRQNYLHVMDAVMYIEKMIDIRSQGIHLGVSGKETSNAELAGIIRSITGARITFKNEDNSPSRSFDNKITRNKLEITYEAPLKEEINEYIAWKRKRF